jgi:hypothetical protein
LTDVCLAAPGLSRWVSKIFKLVEASARLATFPSSRRLHSLINGNVQFEPVLIAPPEPYTVNFSSSHLVHQIKQILTPSEIHPSEAEFVQPFGEFLSKLGDGRLVERVDASIHAELSLLNWLRRNAPDAYPFIGVSKLSCSACWEYMQLDGPYCFSTTGTHGKYYPSWIYPPETEVLEGAAINKRAKQLELMKIQLVDSFKRFVAHSLEIRCLSDGTLGSEGAGSGYRKGVRQIL